MTDSLRLIYGIEFVYDWASYFWFGLYRWNC